MCQEFNDAEIPTSPININGINVDKIYIPDKHDCG